MEHLVVLLIHFVLWLDTKFQKPLRRVIANYDALLHDPEQALAEGELVIGPMRRYASATALGTLFGIVCWVLLLFMLGDDLRRMHVPAIAKLGAALGMLVLI